MKRYMILALALLLSAALVSAFPALAAYNADLPRVIDNREYLSVDEFYGLESRIASIRREYAFDILLITDFNLNGVDQEAYQETRTRYYDSNGYGVGPDHDGIIFLINDDIKWVSGCGRGIAVFPSEVIKSIGRDISPIFDAGDHYAGFMAFLDHTEALLGGDIAEADEVPSNPFINVLLMCLAGSAALALIAVLVMKSRMNTARRQRLAHNYIKDNSFRLTGQSDMFLYKTVTKVKRESDSENKQK